MKSLMSPDALPPNLPVFPLTGCILLPGNWLPLHIFEPRYRALVADSLHCDKFVGMIQPLVPAADNFGPAPHPEEAPDLYRVGCAGRIEHALPESDGRYHILLKGMRRFELHGEMPPVKGYRRFQVSYDGFPDDLAEPERILDSSRILRALQVLRDSHSLSIDPEDFRSLAGVAIINGLSAALPFAPEEKQALLEANGPEERERLLLALMTMGFRQGTGTRYAPSSIIH